jgi:hypothetical protein
MKLTDCVILYRDELARYDAEQAERILKQAEKEAAEVLRKIDGMGLEPTRIDGNIVYLDYEGQEIKLQLIGWRYAEYGGFYRVLEKCPTCDGYFRTDSMELTHENLGRVLCDPPVAYHTCDPETYYHGQKEIQTPAPKSAREKFMDALDDYIAEKLGGAE